MSTSHTPLPEVLVTATAEHPDGQAKVQHAIPDIYCVYNNIIIYSVYEAQALIKLSG